MSSSRGLAVGDSQYRVSTDLNEFLGVFDLDPVGDGVYRGCRSGDDDFGLYGGHLLGQSVAAAFETVDEQRLVHSLHAYFLRGGDGTEPVDYRVDRVRDGRSFCTRRVTAEQKGKDIFEMTASFQTPEVARAELEPSMPSGVLAPEVLPTFEECIEKVGPIFGEQWTSKPFESRIAHAPWAPTGPSADGGIDYWFRVAGDLDDSHGLHASILAYVSDDSISDNMLVPYGVTWGTPEAMLVSLDHAMWIHRPFRLDEWIYVEQRPVVSAGGRGLSTGQMWTADGLLVATMTQEALARF